MNISPYIFPLLSKVKRINRIEEDKVSHIPLSDKNISPKVYFRPDRQEISFSKAAVRLMKLEAGMRINLILIGKELFIYKCRCDGYAIFYKDKKYGTLGTYPRRLIFSLQAIYKMKTSKTFEIKPTNNEYQFAKLYEVLIPKNLILR